MTEHFTFTDPFPDPSVQKLNASGCALLRKEQTNRQTIPRDKRKLEHYIERYRWVYCESTNEAFILPTFQREMYKWCSENW